MKKLMKLFPVAVAAFAMASCSSDDLGKANEAQELNLTPNQLMVQIGGFDDANTRGGFMTTVTDYYLKSALFFNAGDQIKLYHDATSWKPEIWTASEFGQYKNVSGTAVFANPAATITTDEDAYGIFPAGLGQFGNENRTSIQYDLSGMKFIPYSAVAHDYTLADGTVVTPAEDATGNTKAYTAPFPLWGVKKSGETVMTCKHLAGILRVDLADVDNSTLATTAAGVPTNARYIVIKSANKLSGTLKTAVDLLNPTAAEAVDAANLMTKAPKLITEATAAATPWNAIITNPANIVNDDAIVVELTKGAPRHIMLFVPITAGNAGNDIEVRVSNVVPYRSNINLTTGNDLAVYNGQDMTYPLTGDLIDAENKAQLSAAGYAALSAAEKRKVQTGVFYRINDDASNRNTTAKTPFQMAEGIIAADKAAYRDFEMTFVNPIEVKNTDDSPQNFWMNLAGGDDRYGLAEGYDLKHNVTVNVTIKENAEGAAVPSVLYIKTKGGKKLTLNITNGATAVDTIAVVADGIQNEQLILNHVPGVGEPINRLPNLHIYQGNDDKVLIKSGVINTIKTNSNVTFDIPAWGSANEVNELTLAKGVTKVSFLSGDVNIINMEAAASDKINSDVEIYSEGSVSINNVQFANMPYTTGTGTNKIDTYNLVFKSKYIADAAAATYPTTQFNGGGTYVTTAHQLSKLAGATDFTVVGEYDLNGAAGAANAWPSRPTLTKSVIGAQYFRYDNTGARVIVNNATIKNLQGINGLIADWTPAAAGDCIRNFTFDGGSQVSNPAAVTTGTALLVGSVSTATASGTIKNIKIQGTNTVTTTGNSAAVAAVIGKTTGGSDLKLFNINVAAGTSVTSFKYVGGIVGQVDGKVVFGLQSANGNTDKVNGASVAGNDVKNASAASLNTYRISTSAPCSSVLPTKGQFFGGASTIAANGDVKIIGALTQLSAARTDALWGYYLETMNEEYYSWPINLWYEEIGHCGFTTVAAVPGTSDGEVQVDAAVKAIWMYTSTAGANPKYNVVTTLAPYVGKDNATQWQAAKAAQAIGGTMYFDWVKDPR